MAKKPAKKPGRKPPNRKPKPDASQSALAAVEKLIGGKLSDGMRKQKK